MIALNLNGHYWTPGNQAGARLPGTCVLSLVTLATGQPPSGQFVTAKVGTKSNLNIPVGSPAPEDTKPSFHEAADCPWKRLL